VDTIADGEVPTGMVDPSFPRRTVSHLEVVSVEVGNSGSSHQDLMFCYDVYCLSRLTRGKCPATTMPMNNLAPCTQKSSVRNIVSMVWELDLPAAGEAERIFTKAAVSTQRNLAGGGG